MSDVIARNTQGIMQYFDLSVRDQIEAAIKNGASDSFFLFSGTPTFSGLGGVTTFAQGVVNNKLCPLLFATGFQDPDNRAQDGSLMTMGSQQIIAAPSTAAPSPRYIQINAGALVTGSPNRGAGGNGEDNEQWNLLKRIFYFMIKSDKSEISSMFGANGTMYGNEEEKSYAVAPDYNSVWGNFTRSFVYKTPFGLLAVALTKSMGIMSVKYYQGCVLQSVGPALTAGINQPIMFSGSNGITATYTKVRTFPISEAKRLVGDGAGSQEAAYLNSVLKAFF